MTTTYDCIATTTLGSAQASVTFSGISGNFTDLVLVVKGGTTSTGASHVVFNNDDGFYVTRLNGTGSSAVSDRFASSFFTGGNTFTDGMFIVYIFNYSNTAICKTSISRYSDVTSGVFTNVALWDRTSAITTIQVSNTGTYVSGTTFSLYGIKAE